MAAVLPTREAALYHYEVLKDYVAKTFKVYAACVMINL